MNYTSVNKRRLWVLIVFLILYNIKCICENISDLKKRLCFNNFWNSKKKIKKKWLAKKKKNYLTIWENKIYNTKRRNGYGKIEYKREENKKDDYNFMNSSLYLNYISNVKNFLFNKNNDKKKKIYYHKCKKCNIIQAKINDNDSLLSDEEFRNDVDRNDKEYYNIKKEYSENMCNQNRINDLSNCSVSSNNNILNECSSEVKKEMNYPSDNELYDNLNDNTIVHLKSEKCKEKYIRNFCILAHIDSGKSTLADRFLELTNTIKKKRMQEQFLDMMCLEREKGITIKLKAVRMHYNNYIFNLIDTPGHFDFYHEVKRSLNVCEGAILLIDGGKGIQSQTLNIFLELKKHDIKIIPVINKIDLSTCLYDKIKDDLINKFNFKENEILKISAKYGKNIKMLFQRIISDIPPPINTINSFFRGVVFDSFFDQYKGVVLIIKVLNGELRKKTEIFFINSAKSYIIQEVGYLVPEMKPTDVISQGDIAYVCSNIRNCDDIQISETIVNKDIIKKNNNNEFVINFKKINLERDKNIMQRLSDEGKQYLIHHNKGEIKCDENKGQIICDENEGLIKCDENEGQIKCDENEGQVKCDENEGHVKCDENEGHVQCDENEGQVKCDENEGQVKCDENEGQVKCDENEGHVKCDENEGQVKCDENGEIKSFQYNEIKDDERYERNKEEIIYDHEHKKEGTFNIHKNDDRIKDNITEKENFSCSIQGNDNAFPILEKNDINIKSIAANKIEASYPSVYCNIYCVNDKKSNELEMSLNKLKLNDSSFSFKKYICETLGKGFKCGFNGLLHLNIIQERIRREYNIDTIVTAPSVNYLIRVKEKYMDKRLKEKLLEKNFDIQNMYIEQMDKISSNDSFFFMTSNVNDIPTKNVVHSIYEPYVKTNIITPEIYQKYIMNECFKRRGIFIKKEIMNDQIIFLFQMPLSEILINFLDQIKSSTKGYGSMSYENIIIYKPSELYKIHIYINKKKIDSLSFLAHKLNYEDKSRKLVSKLKNLINPHQFLIIIQAALESKIFVSEKIKPLKKNVTAKCYGGDITRRRKLIEKQNEGKKKMFEIGKVKLPPNIFTKLFDIKSE
ncbi:GTP-binding protein, putative [Plasmodium reichenowi]|uniref:GTP-binding protein, putative n=1 Tax=Plasmodium reichenowi TaxID=5854 RepID=A0A060RRY7_PLARE|nr:GTP-binding protein, putative [Plasmodium reichenowi]